MPDTSKMYTLHYAGEIWKRTVMAATVHSDPSTKTELFENAVQTERIYNCRFKNEEGKKLKFVVTF